MTTRALMVVGLCVFTPALSAAQGIAAKGSEVARITQRRGDSLTNGALIRLCIGGATAAIGSTVWAANTVGDTNGGEVALVVAIYAGIGAGIGTGIDALITRRQVIFEEHTTSGVTVAFVPLLTPTRAAARLSIGF